MNRFLQDVVAETLFPPFCVSCEVGGEWWCASCREAVERLTTDPCPSCAALSHADPCPPTSLDGLSAAGFYHDRRLRAVVTNLKYRGATCLLPSIGALLRSWREARRQPWPWAGASAATIVPVPTSPDRVRERGFNQAERIAELVRGEIIPWAAVSDFLQRNRPTPPQADVDPGPLRRANIRGVFSIRPDAEIPRTVILVDDVATTGSTLREAASMLKAHGASSVYGVVLAVGR